MMDTFLTRLPFRKRGRRPAALADPAGILPSSIILVSCSEDRASVVKAGPRMNVGLITTSCVSPPLSLSRSGAGLPLRTPRTPRGWPAAAAQQDQADGLDGLSGRISRRRVVDVGRVTHSAQPGQARPRGGRPPVPPPDTDQLA